jgi:hypothetical protein
MNAEKDMLEWLEDKSLYLPFFYMARSNAALKYGGDLNRSFKELLHELIKEDITEPEDFLQFSLEKGQSFEALFKMRGALNG